MESAAVLALLGLIAAPAVALRWLGRRPDREPLPEPEPFDPASVATPAHQLYVRGDGDALIELLPGLPVAELVPLATALGRYREALESLEGEWSHLLEPDCAQTDDGSLIVRINAAETLSELGRYAEARALVSKRAENPYVETGRCATLAWILTLDGRAEDALGVLRGLDASSLGAEYAAELHLTRAFVMLSLARLVEAKSALVDARSAAVRSSSVRNLLNLEAELAWREGDRDAALKRFEAAAHHHWRWQGGPGLLRWGELLAELGRMEEARAAWTRCVSQDPESTAAALAKTKLSIIGQLPPA